MRHTRVFGVGIPKYAYGLFKNARFGPPPNLHTCISLVEVCRFGQCLGWRFSPIYIFSLACFSAFRGAQQSRFWCRDLKLCLLDSLKMLDLALSQTYTRVFHLWKSLVMDNAWDKDSRPFISFFHWRVFARLAMPHTRVFGVEIPNYAYGLLTNASFGPPPNLHKRISLVEVNRFGQCLGWRFSHISTFFSLVSSRAFRDAPHSRFRCGDPNQCYLTF